MESKLVIGKTIRVWFKSYEHFHSHSGYSAHLRVVQSLFIIFPVCNEPLMLWHHQIESAKWSAVVWLKTLKDTSIK